MNEFSLKQVNELLGSKNTITADDIFKAYCWMGNDVNFKHLDYIKANYKLSKEAYSEAVKHSYTCGKLLQRGFKYFISKKYNWFLVATNEEKEIYNSLPERLTIYRGTSNTEAFGRKYDLGISWSLDRGVAEFFAFRDNLSDRVVVEVEISKTEIRALFNDRTEKEIICVMPEKDVKITTTEKTIYYNQFLQNKKESEVLFLTDKI